MAPNDPSGSSSIVLINNLDAGNPLHIQTNDNSSTTLIPFKLSVTENYKIWSSLMKLALQARNKYSFVDGTCLKNAYSTSDVLSAQWDRCNAIVLTWIMNFVSQDVYIGLVYSDNAVDVWKELESTYDKVDGFVVFNFKQLSLHQQFMKLMQFLMGLDDCYQPVKSALLTRGPLLKVKDAYTTVPIEELHRGIPESSSTTELKMSVISFAAKFANNSRSNYNNNNNSTRGSNNNNMNRGPNPNLVCKNYGMVGHTIERCYEIIGYPPRFKKVSNTIKQSGFNKQNFNANVDVKNNDKQTFPSVPSTGANHDLTVSTVGMFDVIDATSLKIIVGHPNGTLATMSHVGNLKLFCMMFLLFLVIVLGHPSDQVLSVLQSDLNITKNCSVPICEVCHRAKHNRDPFPLSDHKSKGLGELFHLDMAVWVYLVKTKDEVFDVFVSFINLISNQFNVKIKTIRSDNGTEFTEDGLSMIATKLRRPVMLDAYTNLKNSWVVAIPRRYGTGHTMETIHNVATVSKVVSNDEGFVPVARKGGKEENNASSDYGQAGNNKGMESTSKDRHETQFDDEDAVNVYDETTIFMLI
ncbi:ribonuclease H-like domain-containing protein [Tanacetum coccineum]